MQLLKHFKDLTIHPKNAQELTGLILQLAIQGKLTANWRKENPDVEPASELLKRTKKEKNHLIKEKKVRKGKSNQLIEEEEKYLKIPNKWEWTRIIEMGNLFNGNSVNKSLKAAKYEGLEEGYPYLGTKDINYGFEELNYENGVRIPFDEPKFKIAHKNTALICSEGGSAGKKCGITKEDICFGNKLYALEQYGGIESVYILSIYKTPIFFEIFQSKMTGIIGGISINSFGDIPIPLPPLQEQKEIVRVVETLFKEVEQLEQLTVERIALKEDFVTSALQQLTTNNASQEWGYLQEHFKSFFNETTNIKKLRETLLQLAVQGKLTADWRLNNSDTEDASVLLKRIQKEKIQHITDKRIRKENPLASIAKDDIPFEIPKCWVWCRLQDLEYLLGDGIHGTPEYSINGEYYFINGNNLSDGIIEIKSNTKTVSKVEFLKHKRNLTDRTILVSINGTIGNTAFYNDEKVMLGKSACYFNLLAEVDKHYIRQLIKTNYFLNYAFSSATGTTIKNVSLRTMRSFLVPFPPFEEQKAIVQKVKSLMGLCNALEQEVQRSQEQIEQLMQSCLREVFE